MIAGMAQIVPLFIVGFAGALLGWAMVVLRLEREHRKRHPELFSEHRAAENPELTQQWLWIRFLGRWLLP